MISEVNSYGERLRIKDQKIELLKEKKLIYGREIQFLRNENKKLSEKVQNLEEFFKKEDEEEEEEEDAKKECDRLKLGLVRDPEFKFESRSEEPFKTSLTEIKECDRDFGGGGVAVTHIR